MRTGKALVVGLAVCLAMVGVAFAAVIVDDDGFGFVGKGDVQLVFTWNNKQLQDNAEDVQFRVSSITETSWICTNSNNEHTQERSRTTTLAGLVDSVARVKNQITGFNLNGFDDEEMTSTTDGPPLNSCPSGPWTLTTPAGEPVPVEGSGVEVSIDGDAWFPLQ